MGDIIISALGFISSVSEKILANLIAHRLKKLGEADEKQKTIVKKALEHLLEEWLTAILNVLKAQEYLDEDLRQFFENYKVDLEIFLQDTEVAEELLKPFSASTTQYRIDSKLLVRRWTALKLRELPEEFDAASVSRAYLRRVKNAGIVTSELRELFLAQLSQEQTHYLESIRGVWPDFDLNNYAERIKTRYRVLDLSALTPPSRDDVDDGRILLKDIFVPQMVRESRPPRELPKEILDKLYDKGELNRDELPEEFRIDDFKRLQDSWTQAQPESVLTAVAKPENKRLILLGDPGSGKSTLARYLLLSVLAETSEVFKTSEVFAGHLPLLVELRNYRGEVTGSNCAGFLEYFHYLGKTQGYTLNHLKLKEQLKTRPSLIIFDGLDEIFDLVEREKITQEIIGFALEYQDKARVLVTSRIIGYQGKALQAADFREYTLQDLELEQIKIFARGWFDLVFRDKPEEAAFRYKRIETALQNSPAIRQLAGNPLLLTMIAIIAKHQELPRERAKLYEHAVKVLCHHWDVTGHKISVAETPADFMREDDKLELLRRIAWRMQASAKGLAGNFILGDDLHDEIADYLRIRWQLSKIDIGRIGSGMVAQLRERNFSLCLYGAQLYGFVHRTFLEYFCAAEIVYRFEKKQTLSFEELKTSVFFAHFRDETWHEVLRLICGMVEPSFAGKLISTIVPEKKAAFEKTDDLILAVQCLAEVDDLNQIADVAELVLEGLCGWFEPMATRWKFLEKERKFEEHAIPAVEMIGKSWPKREDVVPWLFQSNTNVNSRRAHYSWYGIHAFGKVVAVLWADNQILRQSLITLSDVTVKITQPLMIFDALVHCYGNQENIQKLLKERAINDERINIRQAAISALGHHYTYAPDTQSLLLQIATNDQENSVVRRHTINVLLKDHTNTPETLLPQQVITEIKEADVREAAVKKFAKNCHNDTWLELLSQDLDGYSPWLDSKELIDDKRVEEAAKELEFSPETIRQHYENIAKEIPLRLAWKAVLNG